jgi:hypothetical protein
MTVAEPFMEKATLANFRQLVQESTWEELQQAKELAALLVPFFRDFRVSRHALARPAQRSWTCGTH